jgi:MFS family permease
MRRSGLWRNSDFLKLWAGQAVSQTGSNISAAALQLTAILLLGASPFQMGLMSGAGGGAILVFGLFAGAWADRLRRRPILIFADLGRAIILGTIPLAALLHRLTMAHLYLAAAATGVLTVFFDVSYQAYLPTLAGRENILEGNSKLALTESIAGIVGWGAAGILVQWITAPAAILFDAASFLCSAFSISLIRKPEGRPESGPAPNMGREIAEGLRLSWREPVLRALAMRTGAGSFFLGFLASLYMVFAIRELGLSPALIGIIVSCGGATSLFGALAAERLVRRVGFSRTLIGSAAATGFSTLLPPMAHGTVAVCAAFLGAAQLFDIAWPVYNITELSLRQAVTPDHLLGRVNSAMHLLFNGVMPVGALAGGMIAQGIGIRATMFAGAAGFLLSTLFLIFSPIRHLRELPHAPTLAAGAP